MRCQEKAGCGGQWRIGLRLRAGELGGIKPSRWTGWIGLDWNLCRLSHCWWAGLHRLLG
jgi:hypothetical protein